MKRRYSYLLVLIVLLSSCIKKKYTYEFKFINNSSKTVFKYGWIDHKDTDGPNNLIEIETGDTSEVFSHTDRLPAILLVSPGFEVFAEENDSLIYIGFAKLVDLEKKKTNVIHLFDDKLSELTFED
ncbi:MAG: hypothetical protein MRY83_05245 [Flavobacteriales bacterium]|nr:hypothetical protein [Flavobacteriales bacterium]